MFGSAQRESIILRAEGDSRATGMSCEEFGHPDESGHPLVLYIVLHAN